MDVHWFVDQTAYAPYLRHPCMELSLTLSAVELVSSLCTQPRSVRDSTARPYALLSPSTTPRPIALFAGQSHYYQVGCTIIGLVAPQLGQSCYNWVSHATIGSGVLLSGQSCYYWVRRAVIGSGTLLSGRSCCYWAYLVHFPSMLLFRSFAHSSPPLSVKV